MKKFKKLTFIMLFLAGITAIKAQAQHLPATQKESVLAPVNIKIDGKADEWSNQFKAYNNSTEVFYTISNDDDNLYLVVQATKQQIARKIVAGGITFTIYPTKDKNNKVAITFPVFDRKNLPNIDLKQTPVVTKTSIADSVDVWVFADKINKELSARSKEIGVLGIKGVDSIISVYNEQQIKAVAQFNDQVAYTYELAVPLKYLGLSTNNLNLFNYNIKLNGSDHVEGAFIEYIQGGIRITGTPVPIADMRFFGAPTDLSGEYTLAKKHY